MLFLCTLNSLVSCFAKLFIDLWQVEGVFYVNDPLEKIMFDELKQHTVHKGFGGFLPGMKQIANVAALPGIVGVSYVCITW